MNADILKLENQLCFPLYAAAKAMVKKYAPFLNEIRLTYTQYIAMMVMWEHKTLSVKELGNRLYLDSGTLTPPVEATGKQKTHFQGTGDERFVYISVTTEGIQLKKKAIQVPQKMGKCISLDPSEAQTLYTLLHKLLGQLEGMEDCN
jgi:DNA-binding MarR family transcriptional regulator